MEPYSEWVTAAPSPALGLLVDRYVGYRMAGFPPGLHRGLPSRHMTLIVSIGAGIEVVSHPDPHQPPTTYRCVVGGLQARPALIAHTGCQEGVAVELTPLGCRAVLGLPARALWSTALELVDVAGVPGLELWERLQAADRWDERFRVCDEVLGRLVDHDVAVAPELGAAWRVLVASGGTASIDALAAGVGWSRQHLARRFGDELGLSPKLAARVVRFERARKLLQSTPSFVTVAQVAAVCGYYDQSHLDRDFAELAGCPPTTWLAAEVPSFQDEGDPLVGTSAP